jgi:hypothetical protein
VDDFLADGESLAELKVVDRGSTAPLLDALRNNYKSGNFENQARVLHELALRTNPRTGVARATSGQLADAIEESMGGVQRARRCPSLRRMREGGDGTPGSARYGERSHCCARASDYGRVRRRGSQEDRAPRPCSPCQGVWSHGQRYSVPSARWACRYSPSRTSSVGGRALGAASHSKRWLGLPRDTTRLAACEPIGQVGCNARCPA